MNFFQSAEGMLELEVTSGDIGKTLCDAADLGAVLRDVEVTDSLSARFLISRRDIKILDEICSKNGDNLKVIRYAGIYWKIRNIWKRPLLLLGVTVITALFLFLSTRILFVEIEGNREIPARRIQEAAGSAGLSIGTSRKEVRSEQIKNSLLDSLPGLSWAGINTKGCRAIISVEERKTKEELPENQIAMDVRAVRDGIITSCTANQGILVCRPGQAVMENQMLISGYTDCNGLIQATKAEGEVFAETKRSLYILTAQDHTLKTSRNCIKRRFGLRIGKKYINFSGNSGIYGTSCGRMYEEYYITLPGGYVLPLALTVDQYLLWDTEIVPKDENLIKAGLSSFAEVYLKQHMIAGVILDRQESFGRNNGMFYLEGQYLCREMIGRSRQGKIGE